MDAESSGPPSVSVRHSEVVRFSMLKNNRDSQPSILLNKRAKEPKGNGQTPTMERNQKSRAQTLMTQNILLGSIASEQSMGTNTH